MEIVNLLEFLNNAHRLHSLEYAKCNHELVNFLDLMTEDEQFTRNINLGIVYAEKKYDGNYVLIDGLNRFVSLSILLHAICECYKKTTPQNEKAIKTIRSKYLLSGSKSKLVLSGLENDLYNKIISGERLSGHEKSSHLFILLHNLWTQIKEQKLQAAKIFKMLQKVSIYIVEVDNVPKRDLYYHLNIHNKQLDQISLIEDYLDEKKMLEQWMEIKNSCFAQYEDIKLFFKDFFITKFNYKTFDQERLYESFVNFYETMLQYLPKETIMSRLKRSASLYYNLLNINFDNKNIRNELINIKRYHGEDTYAYILSIYEDYTAKNITEEIFLEILHTIDVYVQRRQQTGQNIDFNELINYLNAFITFK